LRRPASASKVKSYIWLSFQNQHVNEQVRFFMEFMELWCRVNYRTNQVLVFNLVHFPKKALIRGDSIPVSFDPRARIFHSLSIYAFCRFHVTNLQFRLFWFWRVCSYVLSVFQLVLWLVSHIFRMFHSSILCIDSKASNPWLSNTELFAFAFPIFLESRPSSLRIMLFHVGIWSAWEVVSGMLKHLRSLCRSSKSRNTVHVVRLGFRWPRFSSPVRFCGCTLSEGYIKDEVTYAWHSPYVVVSWNPWAILIDSLLSDRQTGLLCAISSYTNRLSTNTPNSKSFSVRLALVSDFLFIFAFTPIQIIWRRKSSYKRFQESVQLNYNRTGSVMLLINH